jgi:hypothetical protein
MVTKLNTYKFPPTFRSQCAPFLWEKMHVKIADNFFFNSVYIFCSVETTIFCPQLGLRSSHCVPQLFLLKVNPSIKLRSFRTFYALQKVFLGSVIQKNEMGKTCSIHDKLIKDFCRKTWRKSPLTNLATGQWMITKSRPESCTAG